MTFVGDDLGSRIELDVSIKSNTKHHDLEESKSISLHEPCAEVIEPTKLEFNNDILSIEYESFACEFDDNESFDEGFYAKYKSFSFDHVQADISFEYCKFEIVESENIVIKNFDLDQTLTCASFARWMYSFWVQLTAFYCFYFMESWLYVFDKLLRVLMGFELSSTFQLDMAWPMLHKFLNC